jgi:peptidoglycan-N-acetylglucosamine deacetylase
MKRSITLCCAVFALCAAAMPAIAAECPGNPDAIGTSRTIVVDPAEHPRIGGMSYPETLPLADKEVVLTFDDGPISPYTDRILDILASECVRANYFIVGDMARARPALVQRAYREGHVIGTHSMSHPLIRRLSLEKAKAQIDDGIEATAAALGDPKELAPFFRFPGFGNTEATDDYAASRGLMVWSADFPADDWMHIGDKEIVRRALMRLEHKGKGVLLLHDIHPATVRALPVLLKELKARGYRIVQVVPASADHPKTETTPEAWMIPKWRQPRLAALLLADVGSLSGDFLSHHQAADMCTLRAMSAKSTLMGRLHRTPSTHSEKADRKFASARPPRRLSGSRHARGGWWFGPY